MPTPCCRYPPPCHPRLPASAAAAASPGARTRPRKVATSHQLPAHNTLTTDRGRSSTRVTPGSDRTWHVTPRHATCRHATHTSAALLRMRCRSNSCQRVYLATPHACNIQVGRQKTGRMPISGLNPPSSFSPSVGGRKWQCRCQQPAAPGTCPSPSPPPAGSSGLHPPACTSGRGHTGSRYELYTLLIVVQTAHTCCAAPLQDTCQLLVPVMHALDGFAHGGSGPAACLHPQQPLRPSCTALAAHMPTGCRFHLPAVPRPLPALPLQLLTCAPAPWPCPVPPALLLTSARPAVAAPSPAPGVTPPAH